jgi:hypothetical protein
MSERIREWIEKASAEFSELLLQEQDVVDGSVDVDWRTAEVLRETGRRIVEQTYEKLGHQLADALKNDGYTVERAPRVRFLVAQGLIHVRSPYLRRPGVKEGIRPLRQEYGIHGSRCSATVLRWIVDFGVERPFEKAAQAMQEHHGLEVGATSMRLRTLAVAKDILGWQRAQLADAPGAEMDEAVDTIFIETDGCHLPVVRWESAGFLGRTDHPKEKLLPVCKWTEARTGLARVAGSVTPRVVCIHGSYDEVNEAVEGLVNQLGGGVDTKLVAIGDGGTGLKESIEDRFPDVSFVLDCGHLRSHVHKAAEVLRIEENREWVDAVVAVLGTGAAQSIIDGLTPLAEAEVARNAGTDETDVLHNVREYLTRFRENLAYDDYEARGWPIGSGEVESAHRYLPQARMKKAGAWWLREHLNPMLAARSIRINDDWNRYWERAA